MLINQSILGSTTSAKQQMNTNYLDLNETQVMLGSMVTSIKWLTITTMILVLVFGYLKKKID